MRQERQTELRFSLGGTASKAALLAILAAIFGYMTLEFGFHFDRASAQFTGGRRQWFWDLAHSDGGKVGALIFAALTLMCVWLLIVLCWRFFTSGKAATLTDRAVVLHPSYRRREIPFAEIIWARVRREALLINAHHLFIQPKSGRRIRLQQNEIEGGREALEAFAAELEARRTFEGGPREGNGDSHE